MEPVTREGRLCLEPEEIIALAASYRHAVLNDLQVIYGWIQLGQVRRAEEYISDLRDIMNVETGLMRAAKPEVAALLLLKRGVGENHGIEIGYGVAEGLRGLDWSPETGTLVSNMIDAAIMLLDRSAQGKRLDLALGGDEHEWYFEMVLDSCVLPEKRFEDSLAEALRLQGSGFDLRLARTRLRAAGGKWRVTRKGSTPGVRLYWPRAGGE